MHGFDDYGHAQRVQGILDAVSDLFRKTLLDLQPAGIGFHDAGDFAQAGNLSLGDICHMRFADEGEHMVLAEGEEFDVLDDDHVVVGLLEEGAFDDGLPVLEIPLRKELHGLGHTFRCLLQPLACGILSQQPQDGFDVAGNLPGGLFVVFFYLFVRHGLFFVADILRIRTAKLAKKNHSIVFFSIFASSIEMGTP